jgi:hypothetical protein
MKVVAEFVCRKWIIFSHGDTIGKTNGKTRKFVPGSPDEKTGLL